MSNETVYCSRVQIRHTSIRKPSSHRTMCTHGPPCELLQHGLIASHTTEQTTATQRSQHAKHLIATARARSSGTRFTTDLTFVKLFLITISLPHCDDGGASDLAILFDTLTRCRHASGGRHAGKKMYKLRSRFQKKNLTHVAHD